LAAGLLLAISFTLSCSTSDPDGAKNMTKLRLANGLQFTSSAEIPDGNSPIITKVQFITADGRSAYGTLIFSSSEELIELYLQIDGEDGYYTKALSSSDIANISNGSYAYSLYLNFAPGLNADELDIKVGGKSNQEEVSELKEAEKSTIEKYSCGSTTITGDVLGFIGSFDMGRNSGSFEFKYDTRNIPDAINIYDSPNATGTPIFHYPSGGTSGWKSTTVDFSHRIITVQVIGSASGTIWDFIVNCPGSSSRPQSSSSPVGSSSSSGNSSPSNGGSCDIADYKKASVIQNIWQLVECQR